VGSGCGCPAGASPVSVQWLKCTFLCFSFSSSPVFGSLSSFRAGCEVKFWIICFYILQPVGRVGVGLGVSRYVDMILDCTRPVTIMVMSTTSAAYPSLPRTPCRPVWPSSNPTLCPVTHTASPYGFSSPAITELSPLRLGSCFPTEDRDLQKK